MSCALVLDEVKLLVLRAVRWVHEGTRMEIYADTDLTSLGNEDTALAYHQAIRTTLGVWGCNPKPSFTVELVASTVAKKKTPDSLGQLVWEHRDVEFSDALDDPRSLTIQSLVLRESLSRRSSSGQQAEPVLAPSRAGLDLHLIQLVERVFALQEKLMTRMERLLDKDEPPKNTKRSVR
jgi:hypothetical protein